MGYLQDLGGGLSQGWKNVQDDPWRAGRAVATGGLSEVYREAKRPGEEAVKRGRSAQKGYAEQGFEAAMGASGQMGAAERE